MMFGGCVAQVLPHITALVFIFNGTGQSITYGRCLVKITIRGIYGRLVATLEVRRVARVLPSALLYFAFIADGLLCLHCAELALALAACSPALGRDTSCPICVI